MGALKVQFFIHCLKEIHHKQIWSNFGHSQNSYYCSLSHWPTSIGNRTWCKGYGIKCDAIGNNLRNTWEYNKVPLESLWQQNRISGSRHFLKTCPSTTSYWVHAAPPHWPCKISIPNHVHHHFCPFLPSLTHASLIADKLLFMRTNPSESTLHAIYT